MKKCSKTILIPIETISRELDYKVYLAMLLSTKGFQVLVGKQVIAQVLVVLMEKLMN